MPDFAWLALLLFASWVLLIIVPLASRLTCRLLGCDWRVMNLHGGPSARCMRCGRQEQMIAEISRRPPPGT
jgi:hypothetical protein